MQWTIPGTVLQIPRSDADRIEEIFSALFLAGGITLGQVTDLTGLEPYTVQNWVKRGFVSSPVKRTYSRQQFARIIIINMLRETLQIERICNLIRVIGKGTEDETDDLIGDEELYHRYVDMLSAHPLYETDPNRVLQAATAASRDFDRSPPYGRAQIVKLLQVMFYAHASAGLRHSSEEILASLQ